MSLDLKKMARVLAGVLFVAAGWRAVFSQGPSSPIRFAYQPIDFTLESCDTPERHAPESMAGGVAAFDYNNDGAPDIFFTNGADIRSLKKTSPKYFNRLFRNDGKGHFQDVTDAAGLAGSGFDVGVAIGDYDNDGYEDIFVGGVQRNTLYHNNGNGTFTDVTTKAGLNKPDHEYGPLWSVGGAWVDLNNDGLLDLIVVSYLSWNIDAEAACMEANHRDYCHPKMYKATPNQVFLNNGDGTFRDVSAESGVRAHPGKGMGIGVADYDLDGRMDFFIANDKVYNSLFHNKGDGKFEEVAFDANVALRENAELISGMGVDFRDLDNDGYPDIAMVALDDETFPIFRNTGKGDFADVTDASRVSALSMPMAGYSPSIFDFDNDRRPHHAHLRAAGDQAFLLFSPTHETNVSLAMGSYLQIGIHPPVAMRRPPLRKGIETVHMNSQRPSEMVSPHRIADSLPLQFRQPLHGLVRSSPTLVELND
jgi:hypothetical protein